MLKFSDLSPVPAAVFVSDVEIIWRGSEGDMFRSCSQCSLWDFFTPILLISLSWYLLRATLFYWDFMGKRFYINEMKALGCFWTNGGYFTRGIVKCWVGLYRWCQRHRRACGWCCCLPLASSGKDCQPADVCIPLSLLLLLSQRASSRRFISSISIRGNWLSSCAPCDRK